MVTLGLSSGPESEVDVRRVYSDELAILGTYAQSKADMEKVLALASDGQLRPSVHKCLPLSAATEAHDLIESRDAQG